MANKTPIDTAENEENIPIRGMAIRGYKVDENTRQTLQVSGLTFVVIHG